MAKTTIPPRSLVEIILYCDEHKCGVEVGIDTYKHRVIRDRTRYSGGPDKYVNKIDLRVVFKAEEDGRMVKVNHPENQYQHLMVPTELGLGVAKLHQGLYQRIDGRLLVTKPQSPNARWGMLCRILRATDTRYYVEVLDQGDEEYRTTHRHGESYYVKPEDVRVVGISANQYELLKKAYLDYDKAVGSVVDDETNDPEIRDLLQKLAAAREKFRNRLPASRAKLEADIAVALDPTPVTDDGMRLIPL